jgi:hypothetical protein
MVRNRAALEWESCGTFSAERWQIGTDKVSLDTASEVIDG